MMKKKAAKGNMEAGGMRSTFLFFFAFFYEYTNRDALPRPTLLFLASVGEESLVVCAVQRTTTRRINASRNCP